MPQSLDPIVEERLFQSSARVVIEGEINRPIDASAASDRSSARSLLRGQEERRQNFIDVLGRPYDKAFEILYDGTHTVFHVGRQHVEVGLDLIIDFRAEQAREQFSRAVSEIRVMQFKEDEIVNVLVDGRRQGSGLRSLKIEDSELRSHGKSGRKKLNRQYKSKRLDRDDKSTKKIKSGDESKATSHTDGGRGFVDAILSSMVSRRGGKMNDIVATIQADQDAMMRLPTTSALAIDGGPGTGKTVVGLHRLAFVAYESRQTGVDNSLLMVGPSEQFIKYVGGVLMSLGERQVRQTSFGSLCATVLSEDERKSFRVSIAETDATTLVKSSQLIFQVMRRMLLSRIRLAYIEIKSADPIWISPAQIEACILEQVTDFLSGAISLRAVREHLGNWIFSYAGEMSNFAETKIRKDQTEFVKGDVDARRQSGEKIVVLSVSPNTRGTTVRSEATQLAERLIPKDEPLALLARFHDLQIDVFPSQDSPFAALEHERLLRNVIACSENPETVKARRGGAISKFDLPLLHELGVALHEYPVQPYSHVMVDEVQDFTPAMLTVVSRYVSQEQVTLLGDFNQRTRSDAVTSWDELKRFLGLRQLDRAILTRSYRVPKQAIELAARVLPPDRRRLVPEGIRSGETPEFYRVSSRRLHSQIAKLVAKADEGQIMIIAMKELALNFKFDDERVVVVDPRGANGLEAGLVVVVEPASWVTETDESRNLLYVALTRTMSRLAIVHSEDLPFGISKSRRRSKAKVEIEEASQLRRSRWKKRL